MATAGPSLPTAATGNTGTIGGGSIAWGTPTNIELADGTSATAVLPSASISTQISDDLIGTGFGFSIPVGSTINGILLEINVKQSVIAGGGAIENSIHLLKAGASAGADKATGAQPGTALAIATYGGSADLWSTTWTPADINNANFGAAASYQNSVLASRTVSVDFFRITVTFTPPASTSTSQMFKVF